MQIHVPKGFFLLQKITWKSKLEHVAGELFYHEFIIYFIIYKYNIFIIYFTQKNKH